MSRASAPGPPPSHPGLNLFEGLPALGKVKWARLGQLRTPACPRKLRKLGTVPRSYFLVKTASSPLEVATTYDCQLQEIPSSAAKHSSRPADCQHVALWRTSFFSPAPRKASSPLPKHRCTAANAGLGPSRQTSTRREMGAVKKIFLFSKKTLERRLLPFSLL